MPAHRISIPEIVDARGRLIFAEEGRHVPFAIKRVFAIYGIQEGATRADHAHRQQQQLLVMLAGECRVIIDDGKARREEHLDAPTEGLYVPALNWVKLVDFARAAVCLVLASGFYDAADYVRDYSEFKKIVATKIN
jgi:oxalate decarboxylase/phosphoglucose isomerase-like protein (cupin superfamily)